MARRRKYSNSLKARKNRILRKEREIRESGNIVTLNENVINDTMSKFQHYKLRYRIDEWGEIRVNSRYGSWIVRHDEQVIFLWHANERGIRVGNDRSSYHLHNVFYDLEYCVNSIVEHDRYILNR